MSAPADEAYRAAAAARPDFGDACWSLANLKTYRFAESEISRMRTEEAAPATAVADRYHPCFALGKALEDRGEYEESWSYYERGNALNCPESRYRPELIQRRDRSSFEQARTGSFVPTKLVDGWKPEHRLSVAMSGWKTSGCA